MHFFLPVPVLVSLILWIMFQSILFVIQVELNFQLSFKLFFIKKNIHIHVYLKLNETEFSNFFQDPAKRLGGGADDAKEIMAHIFFSSINWKDLEERKVKLNCLLTITCMKLSTKITLLSLVH